MSEKQRDAERSAASDEHTALRLMPVAAGALSGNVRLGMHRTGVGVDCG